MLEEIAMYEDDPQDQIHDLASLAVFPDQALGRPVIGTAQVIGSVPEDGVRAYHRGHYTAPEHRRRRGRATSPTSASASWPTQLLGRPPARAGRRASTRPPEPGRADARGEGEGHRAVPPLPGRARAVAQRPAPPRPVGARRRARRLDEQPALPGGAREARPRLLGRLLRGGLRRHGPGGRLPGHPRGQPRDGLRGRRRRAAAHRRGAAARRRAAAREGPPQGAPGARHGELGHADEPHRAGRAHRAPSC